MAKKKICVLEDNDDIREIIEMLLESEHFEVNSFATVQSFMNASLQQDVDTYILDVMLPDGNGIDVCRQLKHNQKTSSVPVVMMSANNNYTDIMAVCQAQDFIRKPFDIDDFVKRVVVQTAFRD